MTKRNYFVYIDILFVVFVLLFFYSKSSIVALLALIFYIGSGFSQYFRQKRRVKTENKEIIKLLKIENIFYWFTMLVIFIFIYYINKPPLPVDRMYFLVVIFVLAFITYFIGGKRKRLLYDEMNK